MKQLILFLLVVLPMVGRGQMVGGKQIDQDPAIQYIQVMVINDTDLSVFGGKKVTFRYLVSVDFGQDMSTGTGNDNRPELHNRILAPDGSIRVFVSEMEVFNFFAGYGWRFVQVMPPAPMAISATYLFVKK